MKVLGISGTLFGQKTTSLVQQVLTEIQQVNSTLDIELLDLSKFQLQFCDGRPFAHYNSDTQQLIQKITTADCLIIGTPIFQASLTGALKNLFDLTPPDALRGKIMGFVATGGTYQHFLVIENQLKPIAGYFKAYVVPEYIYAHRDHFNENNEIADTELLQRISLFAKQVITMSEIFQPIKIN